MKNFNILLFLLLGFLCPLQAQNPLPESVYHFMMATADSEIQQSIEKNQKFYTPQDWAKAQSFVRENNANMTKNMNKLDENIANLYDNLNTLHVSQAVVQQKKLLDSLQKAKNEMINDATSHLKDIQFKGLYLVALQHVNPLTKEQDNKLKVQKTLCATAIATCNGAFLKSVTEISNNQVLKDKIEQSVQGDMQVDMSEFRAKNLESQLYVEILKVSVSPLSSQKNENALATQGEGSDKLFISDLYHNPDIEIELQKLGSPDLIEKVKQFISEQLPSLNQQIESENETAESKGKKILTDYQKKLAKLDKEITETEAKVNENNKNINEIANALSFTLQKENLGISLKNLQNKMLAEIKRLQSEKKKEKEKELIVDTYTTAGQSGEPAASIAQSVNRKAKSIDEGNQKILHFQQVITIENQVPAEFQESSATDIYRKASEFWMYPILKGDMFEIGVVVKFTMTGEHAPQNEEIIKKEVVIEKNNPSAEVAAYYGQITEDEQTYNDGIMPQNPPKSQAVQKTASTEDVVSNLSMAVQYFNNKEYAKAFPIFFKHKESKIFHADHAYCLGFMYYKGFATTQSYENAFAWFLVASTDNQATAMCFLGIMYENGEWVERNYKEAFYWYKMSADLSSQHGQYNIGRLYEEGWGVSQDITNAIYYYRLAAKQGNEKSFSALKRLGY